MALIPKAKDLSNVTVTAVKPFIETKLDRTIVNVEALHPALDPQPWKCLKNPRV